VSLRVAAPLAVTDEAIVPDNGIFTLPLVEKDCFVRLTARLAMTPDRNDIKG